MRRKVFAGQAATRVLFMRRHGYKLGKLLAYLRRFMWTRFEPQQHARYVMARVEWLVARAIQMMPSTQRVSSNAEARRQRGFELRSRNMQLRREQMQRRACTHAHAEDTNHICRHPHSCMPMMGGPLGTCMGTGGGAERWDMGTARGRWALWARLRGRAPPVT